ncbi:MAG: Trm112 family protein [DPANN group archaeon]|nr:Trm112 family protein [DPANN group archaeon]
MPVPKDLIKIMACPKCKSDIEEKDMFIICKKCKLAYPILDNDIPNMLIDDAWILKDAEKTKFKHEIKI